jgi:hypothetical protein
MSLDRWFEEVARQLHDEAIGWHCDETRQLRLRYNGVTSDELDAEIMRKPSFGFTSRRDRTLVKVELSKAAAVQLPRQGITFLDKDQLFGQEGAWKIFDAYAAPESEVGEVLFEEE